MTGILGYCNVYVAGFHHPDFPREPQLDPAEF